MWDCVRMWRGSWGVRERTGTIGAVESFAGVVFGDDEVAETQRAGGVEIPVGAEKVRFLLVGHGCWKGSIFG